MFTIWWHSSKQFFGLLQHAFTPRYFQLDTSLIIIQSKHQQIREDTREGLQRPTDKKRSTTNYAGLVIRMIRLWQTIYNDLCLAETKAVEYVSKDKPANQDPRYEGWPTKVLLWQADSAVRGTYWLAFIWRMCKAESRWTTLNIKDLAANDITRSLSDCQFGGESRDQFFCQVIFKNGTLSNVAIFHGSKSSSQLNCYSTKALVDHFVDSNRIFEVWHSWERNHDHNLLNYIGHCLLIESSRLASTFHTTVSKMTSMVSTVPLADSF